MFLAKSLGALFLLTAAADASVILNAPGPNQSGFYNFYSDELIGTLFDVLMPEQNGLAARKLYGSAGIVGSNPFSAYLGVVAYGTASGQFDVDTELIVQYKIAVAASPGFYDLPIHVTAYIQTSENGYFATEAFGTMPVDGTGQTDGSTQVLYKDGFASYIPAGDHVTAWGIVLSVGAYGVSSLPFDLTLTIPQNSIEFYALGSGQPTPEVPEPATLGFAGVGLTALGWAARKHRRTDRSPEALEQLG